MHRPIPQQGRWLQQVVTDYFNYHAVPTNSSTLTAFLFHVRPHAGDHLVRHPVDLYCVVDLVETAGLALHDEEPERISRLFDETIADFLIGMGRSWACGKCRQRGLKPPSKPSEC